MSERIHPLAEVKPIWEHDWSDYPDIIRVAMEDGKVINYYIDVELPHPAFTKAMDLIDKLPVYGGYKAPETKKRRRR